MADETSKSPPEPNSSITANTTKPAIPENFGAENGAEVVNKGTILDDVDRALGRKCPPAVEYILVNPFSAVRLPFFNIGLSYNHYGHACVRYTLPNGEQKLMNIVGKKTGNVMVKFVSPSEFLFSTNFSNRALEQKGLYNRSMVGVRIEELPDEKILAMHEFFCDLEKQAAADEKKFNIILGPLYNLVAKLLFVLPIAEYGNCAYWTSKGLEKAEVITNKSIWPKSIWINMFENTKKTAAKDPSNMHVVSYRRIPHAKLSYGSNAEAPPAVAPLQSLRMIWYWNLERFAHAIVDVPDGTMEAQVTRIQDPASPSELRNVVNHYWFIALSVTITGTFIFRKNREFTNRLGGIFSRRQGPFHQQ